MRTTGMAMILQGEDESTTQTKEETAHVKMNSVLMEDNTRMSNWGIYNVRVNSWSPVPTHLHGYSNEEEEVELEETYHNLIILVHRWRGT